MLRSVVIVLCSLGILYLLLVALITFNQRSLLYFPGHATTAGSHTGAWVGLSPWKINGSVVGFARETPQPMAVWLMLHGNGGQAADRDYVLPCLPAGAALFVMEYPGYGARPGKPGRTTIDKAAREAYHHLRARYPKTPVCVVGESLGSGPASSLAAENPPPDKIVLVVPYDTLPRVAAKHFPYVPAGLLLFDRWDNIAALKQYRGPVEIFGAVDDTVISIEHARTLARQVPGAVLHEIPGGHNDWATPAKVVLEYAPASTATQR